MIKPLALLGHLSINFHVKEEATTRDDETDFLPRIFFARQLLYLPYVPAALLLIIDTITFNHR